MRRSSSLASSPTAVNMRRSVLRWSMATMENTWLSVAMSSSVPVRDFVACDISFLLGDGFCVDVGDRAPMNLGDRPCADLGDRACLDGGGRACLDGIGGRLPDEVGDGLALAGEGERGQQGGPGDARLYDG